MIYYINTATHEIHEENCNWKPGVNITYLGIYEHLLEATDAAKSSGYSNANGCHYCCSPENE
nr:hypothetical protein [uncultured Cetobacterium sp.]